MNSQPKVEWLAAILFLFFFNIFLCIYFGQAVGHEGS